MRDNGYKRFGTLSLLAGINLLASETIPLVIGINESADFIEFLINLMRSTLSAK